ncbi:unnamed protein product, partial [Ectocarpus fasciculatus]
EGPDTACLWQQDAPHRAISTRGQSYKRPICRRQQQRRFCQTRSKTRVLPSNTQPSSSNSGSKMPKDAEAERLKKMKKMSRVLGINIHQVAAMLEKQERAANGEIDEEEETPPAAAAAAPAAAAAAKPENDDPFSKFMREQNGGAEGEAAGAAGSGAASSAVATKPSAKKKDEEMPPCTVLFIGGTDWTALGRRPTEGDVLCPKRLLSFPKKIKSVASGPTACHSVCIDVQGGVYTWGRNEFGGLGHGDTAPRAHPT